VITYLFSNDDSQFNTMPEKRVLLNFFESFEKTIFGWIVSRSLNVLIDDMRVDWMHAF
jgi:hypothetical protein